MSAGRAKVRSIYKMPLEKSLLKESLIYGRCVGAASVGSSPTGMQFLARGISFPKRFVAIRIAKT